MHIYCLTSITLSVYYLNDTEVIVMDDLYSVRGTQNEKTMG